MGIALQQWRIKIGGFHGGKSGKWYGQAQELCYSFTSESIAAFLYLATLSLILSGDIEKNPGPVTFLENLPCRGNFHQGHSIFSPESCGRQCLPCCIAFFLQIAIKPSNWKSEDLDSVLRVGDYIYREILKNSSITYTYLHPTELPSVIKFQGASFSLKLKKTYSGSILKGFMGDYPLLSLENALTVGLSLEKHAIFVCKGSASAILMQEDTFVVFDSHSRDINGMCVADGRSIVLGHSNLLLLCNYLRNLITSMDSNPISLNIQYDLHIFTLKPITERSFLQYKSNHKSFKPIVIVPNTVLKSINNVNCTATLPIVQKSCVPVVDLHSHTANVSHEQRPFILIDLPFLDPLPTSIGKNKNKDVRLADNNRKRKLCSNSSRNADSAGNKKNKLTKSVSSSSTINNKSCCDIVSNFHNLVKNGPEYICTSCSQLFFKHSVIHYKEGYLTKQVCVTGTKSVNGIEWLCLTCHAYLKKGKVPPCSIGNNLKLPDIPAELADLTDLEERLTAPRIPFMQLRELPRGGQHGITGNVINVPSDVNTTVRMLPRDMNMCETIPLKLKRSLSLKNYVLFQQIRPEKILSAVKWLVANSLLFRNEGIQIDETWLYKISNEITNAQHMNASENSELVETDGDNDTDHWSEPDESRQPCGNLDTVMQPADFREFNRILTIAPTEGNVPCRVSCFS